MPKEKQSKKTGKKASAKRGRGLPSMKTKDKSVHALGVLRGEIKGKMEGVQRAKGSGKITPPPSASPQDNLPSMKRSAGKRAEALEALARDLKGGKKPRRPSQAK